MVQTLILSVFGLTLAEFFLDVTRIESNKGEFELSDLYLNTLFKN